MGLRLTSVTEYLLVMRGILDIIFHNPFVKEMLAVIGDGALRWKRVAVLLCPHSLLSVWLVIL